jgi:curli biogenesis system outer membrane secretion channel CsgG
VRPVITICLILGFLLVTASCSSGPRIFSQRAGSTATETTLAILPFDNYSGKEDAGKQVANVFLVELLKRGSFRVVEPGEVERVMKEERIRSAEQIDIGTAKNLKDKLSADYILIGAVNEYDYLKDGERDVPLVGFTVRILNTSTGTIVWAANHSKRGDEGELIFGWGSVNSLDQLTQNCVRDVISHIKFDR